ncbi:hypothetical protein EDB80DRAFT_380870 [Ilyonectria destructans]|nr:hypothetical protein EDB80DRAFT_380870 [Ilyonectria destructans]
MRPVRSPRLVETDKAPLPFSLPSQPGSLVPPRRRSLPTGLLLLLLLPATSAARCDSTSRCGDPPAMRAGSTSTACNTQHGSNASPPASMRHAACSNGGPCRKPTHAPPAAGFSLAQIRPQFQSQWQHDVQYPSLRAHPLSSLTTTPTPAGPLPSGTPLVLQTSSFLRASHA